MAEQEEASFFDRPLLDLLQLNGEKAIYGAIFLLAVASRFWDVGARAMSFDECTHTLYSYYLYNGTGFTHDPLMHGPFLFHANALIYFLFGDNDFTSRIVPALFGVLLVMSPLLLRRWLGRLGAILTSILLLISPSILFYSRYIRNEVYIAVWMVLLTAALFHFLESRRPRWFYLGAAVLMLSLATKENAYFFGFIGLVFLLAAVVWERVRPGRRVWLYLGGVALSTVLLAGAYYLGRPQTEGSGSSGAAGQATTLLLALMTVVGGTMPAVLISARLIRSRYPRASRVEDALRTLAWRNWLIVGVVMLLIYTLLFSTFFTSPTGLLTGIFGSLSYWLAQQDVQRGSQPWYYYPLLLTMYEFVPLLFGLLGMVYYLIRRPSARPEIQEDDLQAQPGVLTTEAEAPDPTQDNPRQPLSKAWSTSAATSNYDALFVSFLTFWTLTSLFLYSWAGEKMPWMVVHCALPLIVLAGRFSGDVLGRVGWPVSRHQGGRAKFALYALFALVFIALSIFTARFAWMAAYIHYDYATELLVYAHGTPDVKLTMDEIAGISRRTVGDRLIKVAYDQEAAWPIEWYMREFPNHVFYGDTPTREKLDAPIVLASAEIDARVQPFLGDRYHRIKRRELWWPNQQYMDLTWDRIRDILGDPEKRQALWRILYAREYPRTTDDWYHVDNIYMYVRKDVAQQLWDYGAGPQLMSGPPPDRYAEAHVDRTAARTWGGPGTEFGQFNHPRGVAVGPEGSVYVVDSDNHRVQIFDNDGAFLRGWGSQCNLDTGLGCSDPDGDGPLESGDGQFQEPWGIHVDDAGQVYVADTWNHRIQVFDATGMFLTKWGSFGQVSSAEGGESLLWGPRDVTVGAGDRVFVADTGNKRIMVYDQAGRLLQQWGGGGIVAGHFDEPVGLALSDGIDQRLHVADTWNQRVQVFGSELRFLHEWPVEAWYGDSVANKPYLAVDGQGRVYITDPEGYRVAVFDAGGSLLLTFGRYGFDNRSLNLPTGIAVDEEGNVYVTDTGNHRVLRFEPLP